MEEKKIFFSIQVSFRTIMKMIITNYKSQNKKNQHTSHIRTFPNFFEKKNKKHLRQNSPNKFSYKSQTG